MVYLSMGQRQLRLTSAFRDPPAILVLAGYWQSWFQTMKTPGWVVLQF